MRTKEVRDSGKLELFMAHLNQHIQVWSTLDPTLLKAYGIPPYLAAEMDTEGNAPASDSSPGISELLGSNLKSEQPKK